MKTNTIQIEHRSVGDIDVMEIGGELSIHSAYILERSLLEQMDAGRYKFVINCSKLDTLASAALGMFMARIEDIREAGGDIKFSNLKRNVYHVFDLLDFPTLYDIVDKESEAIDRFKQTS